MTFDEVKECGECRQAYVGDRCPNPAGCQPGIRALGIAIREWEARRSEYVREQTARTSIMASAAREQFERANPKPELGKEVQPTLFRALATSNGIVYAIA